MYTEILTQLDLAKNEAKIYETLLKNGGLAPGKVAHKAEINRRNVYDSLNRLIEKGLVYEVIGSGENIYEAVDPKKLLEIVKEKEVAIQKILPELEQQFGAKKGGNKVFIYKGVEGWKNYLRNVLQVGEDMFDIGARGALFDPKLASFMEQFMKESKRLNIKQHYLFDHEVSKLGNRDLKYFCDEYRFLPKGFSTNAAVDIFGDYVVILSGVGLGKIEDDSMATVIINPNIADAFRTWWQFMWN